MSLCSTLLDSRGIVVNRKDKNISLWSFYSGGRDTIKKLVNYIFLVIDAMEKNLLREDRECGFE